VQTDDDGGFSHCAVGAIRWMVVFDMEETKNSGVPCTPLFAILM